MSRWQEAADRRSGRRAQAEARRAERKRRAARSASQAAPPRLGRLRRPAERPGHQASTAHVQAAYPAMAEAGLGHQGVLIGRDGFGGSFVYDPWVLYARRIVTNANTIVIGSPGYGKSALTKTYLLRQNVFGRVAEIIDPKGEYRPLVMALGGAIIRLEPGGSVQLNPLTRMGTPEMRVGLLEAVSRAMLARPLRQAEAVGLAGALAAADAAHAEREVVIPDVVDELRDPSKPLVDALGMQIEEARESLRECALALQRLCGGALRGMFDGPTTAGDAVWDAPAIGLDLSAVGRDGRGDDLALGIMMVCATAFLDARRMQRAREADAAGRRAPKVVRVNDEAWRALPIAGLGEYFQAAFKLSRESGVQHWLVLHRLSDLRAAGDEGTRQQRLAQGLLSDASTTIVYRQHPAEAPVTADLLGLTSTEAGIIGSLPIGEALWRFGGRSFLVTHALSDVELDIIDSDGAMADDRIDRALDEAAAEGQAILTADEHGLAVAS